MQHETRKRQPLLTLERARANREQVSFADLPVRPSPAFVPSSRT